MPLTDAQKRAMKTYQPKNKDKFAGISRQYRNDNPTYTHDYYYANLERNRERSREYQDRRYKFIQEAKRLCKINIV